MMVKQKKGLATIGEMVAAKRGPAPAPARETFSSAMTRIALEKGVSHYDIAKVCKTTRRTVIAWSQGDAVPTRGEFGRMCVALPQLRHFPPDFAIDKNAESTVDEGLPKTVGLMVWADGGEVAPVAPATFGENLRRTRTAEKLDATEVAEAAGFGANGRDVEAWEANRSEPSLPQAVKLLDRLPKLAEGPPPPSVVEAWQRISGRTEEEDEDELPERGSAERTAQVRAIARKFLEEAPTPEARQRRLESIREELPRWTRRALGIRGEMPALRPGPRAVASLTKKCPRCAAEVDDLISHRDRCPKRRPKNQRWELGLEGTVAAKPPQFVAGTMVSRSPAPSEDAGDRKVVGSEAVVATEAMTEGLRTPPTAPDSGPPPLGSSERISYEIKTFEETIRSEERSKVVDGLELAARCLVLADMLWPNEVHRLAIWFATGLWYVAVEDSAAKGGLGRTRGEGSGVDKRDAVRALADALRAETKERARAAEEMARLLED